MIMWWIKTLICRVLGHDDKPIASGRARIFCNRCGAIL